MTVEREARAGDLLRDAMGLGPARVVLRSCSGFMELFCSTDAFELTGEWLTVRNASGHLHVQVETLQGACLLRPGGDAYPHAASVWLLGRCGGPCVIVILDVTLGDQRVRQVAAFEQLRARWGERVAFTEPAEAGERTLH